MTVEWVCDRKCAENKERSYPFTVYFISIAGSVEMSWKS